MTKEFEIGINLLKKVQNELKELMNVQDKLTARSISKAILNPIIASAYQIRVGSGPYREEILENLLYLVKEMRDLGDINGIREKIQRVLQILKSIEEASQEKKEG